MKPVFQDLTEYAAESHLLCFDVIVDSRSDAWHYHPEIEICYVKQGSGIRFIGNNVENFSTGDLLICGSNLPHNYIVRQDHATETATVTVIQFPLSTIPQVPIFAEVRDLFEQSKRGLQITQLSHRSEQLLENLSAAAPLKQYLDLLQFLHDIVESAEIRTLVSADYVSPQINDASVDRFTKMHNYLVENLGQSISLDQLSNRANMAPQSFCRWFKKVAGTSFTDYFNRLKIEHSCQLLAKEHSQIASIASQVGFGSISHFNRMFKRYKSISPKEYRHLYQ